MMPRKLPLHHFLFGKWFPSPSRAWGGIQFFRQPGEIGVAHGFIRRPPLLGLIDDGVRIEPVEQLPFLGRALAAVSASPYQPLSWSLKSLGGGKLVRQL